MKKRKVLKPAKRGTISPAKVKKAVKKAIKKTEKLPCRPDGGRDGSGMMF